MGTENYGLQNQTFKYMSDARAKLFNKLITGLLPTGVLSGGELSVVNDTTISISPLAVLIRANNLEAPDEVVVRVETELEILQEMTIENSTTLDETRPYIILRFEWLESESNFMDVKRVGYSSDPNEENEDKLWPNDIILGKILFEDDGLGGRRIAQTEGENIDLSRRSVSHIPTITRHTHELKVTTSESNPKRVTVVGGGLKTPKGTQSIVGGTFPSVDITDTTTNGRIDIIYVDVDGNLQYEEGVASSSPEVPIYYGKYVIAEIHRGANRSDIQGYDIRQVHQLREGSLDTTSLLHIDTGNYYPDLTTLNDVLQNIGSTLFDIILGTDTPSYDHVKDYHIDWGTGGDQVSAKDVPIKDADNVFTASDVEVALKELYDLIHYEIANHDTQHDDRYVKQINGECPEDIVMAQGKRIVFTDGSGQVGGSALGMDGEDFVVYEQEDVDKEMLRIRDDVAGQDKYIAVYGEKIWHTGNMSHGSGLDADTLDGSHKDTDGTLSGNSDSSIPTEKAVKTYVDTKTTHGLIFRENLGASVDLNSITEGGIYHQGNNSNASSGSNYPTALAGVLTVLNNRGSLHIYQEYTVYNSNVTYHRSRYNGNWIPWTKVWNSHTDGAGSGLNADLVDDLHASQFVRSDTDDTITGDLLLTGALSYSEDANVHVLRPQGGIFDGESSHTGALKITLPVRNTDSMLFMTVDVYDYGGGFDGESFRMLLGGYNCTGGWENVFATCLAGRTDRYFKVRFGDDGSKRCIYIGETTTNWTHPQINVHDVYVGHSGANAGNYADGWSIGFTTSFGTVYKTKTSELIASHAINADTLDGQHAPSGTIVGTSDTQTLTNKTLTTPDINGGTADNLTSLTVANHVDIGNYNLTARVIQADVATGTAPFTVASTTKVTNLNADKLDGQEGSYYAVKNDVYHNNGEDTVTGNIIQDADKYYKSGKNYVNYPFELAELAGVGTVYILLCRNARGNNVNGRFVLNRTSGHYQASIVDVVVTNAYSTDNQGGAISVLQVREYSETYNLKTLTYNDVSWIALEINGNGYFNSGNVYFTGRHETTDDIYDEPFIGKLSTSVSDVTDFGGDTRQYFSVDDIYIQENRVVTSDEIPSGGFAGITASQTLTNKTLTSPDINSPDIDGGTVNSITSLTVANNVDIGNYQLQAKNFKSDVATGTAPLTVASTTMVENLNADMVDGLEASQFLRSDANDTTSGELTIHSHAKISVDTANKSILFTYV